MTKPKISAFYRTKDYQTALILYAGGQTLNSNEWINKVCFFIFESENECEKLLLKHRKDGIKLSSQAVVNALNTIKSILNSK